MIDAQVCPGEPPARESAAMDRHVTSRLSYLMPSSVAPVSYAYEPPDGIPWESAGYDDLPVTIHNARGQGARLDVEGFTLVHTPTGVKDFDDPQEIRSLYYEEVLEVALAATGGARGYVFDHLVRRRDPDQSTLSFGRRKPGGLASANGRIHNDYTEASGRRRLRLLLGDGPEAESVGRYCIVNVWRPICHPALDAPLALLDARTVMCRDLVAGEVRYRGRTGEIYLLRHSTLHRWNYFPSMDVSEAVVFKQYDSQVSGVARFTPHSAFDDPTTPAATPPRQSIEVRCLVIFD